MTHDIYCAAVLSCLFLSIYIHKQTNNTNNKERELYGNTTRPPDVLPTRGRPRQQMPPHRIQQLEKMGFEWRVRPLAVKWEGRYQELIDFLGEHGHCNIPQKYDPNPILGKWVMKQRGFY